MRNNHRNPDYKKWLSIDLWELQEAISLLCEIEPSSIRFQYKDEERYKNTQFWSKFEVIEKIAVNSIEARKLEIHSRWPNPLYSKLEPLKFLEWANSKGIKLPKTLKKFLTVNRNTEVQSLENNPEPRKKEHQEEKQTIPKEKSLRPCQLAKKLCQVIALTLWDIYPELTITKMVEHNSIQEYGMAKHYKGKNTVRDWLSEVDPRSSKLKNGRPKIK